MVRAELAGQFDLATASDMRIAVIPPTRGSDIQVLRERNELVSFASIGDAVLAVFDGSVDAIISVDSLIFSALRSAHLDHILTIVGPPSQEVDRYIAIHKDRADLLDPIKCCACTAGSRWAARGASAAIFHQGPRAAF